MLKGIQLVESVKVLPKLIKLVDLLTCIIVTNQM